MWIGVSALLAAPVARAADLQAHYSGSSMAADSSSRVITLEFAKDGTGSYDERSGVREVSRPIHWSRNGKIVTVALKPEDGKEAEPPLVFELKRKSLVPHGAKASQLGVFAFPTLHPFGPESLGNASGMTSCVTGAPGPCLLRETWNSNKSGK
jgi:hypothetical protein